MNKKSSKKGISLVALVITIIVLIIITSAIIFSFNKDGILNKTEQAVLKNNIATIQEMLQFANTDKMNQTLGREKINILQEENQNYDELIKEALKKYDNSRLLEREINGHTYAQIIQISNGKLYQSDTIADSSNKRDMEICGILSSMGIESLFIEVPLYATDENAIFKGAKYTNSDKAQIKDIMGKPEGTTLVIPNTYIDENGNKFRIDRIGNTWGNISNMNANLKDTRKIIVSKGITILDQYAFFQTNYIEEYVLPKGLTSIGYAAFQMNKNLVNITLPSTLTYIGEYAFRNCEKIGTNKSAGEESLNLSQTSVNQIGQWAFSWCVGLKKIILPETLKTVGINTFIYSTGLEEVYIPGSLTTISGGMFSGCTALNKVTISEGVQKIDRSAFASCSSEKFTNIIIPSSVKKISASAFVGANTNLVIKVMNTKEYCDTNFEANWNKKVSSSSSTELFTTEYTDQIVYSDGTIVQK